MLQLHSGGEKIKIRWSILFYHHYSGSELSTFSPCDRCHIGYSFFYSRYCLSFLLFYFLFFSISPLILPLTVTLTVIFCILSSSPRAAAGTFSSQAAQLTKIRKICDQMESPATKFGIDEHSILTKEVLPDTEFLKVKFYCYLIPCFQYFNRLIHCFFVFLFFCYFFSFLTLYLIIFV